MSKRSRTAERRKEREQRRKRQRQLTLLAGVIIIAVVAVALILVSNQPAEAPLTEESALRYADLLTGYTEDGFPRLGDPQSSVRVVEYSSFDCPHCATFHDEAVLPLIERVRTGDISFTYIPIYGTGGVDNGEGAARAALCAGQQGDENFWIMHDTLFNWQVTYGNQAFVTNRLSSAAETLGLNVESFTSCFNASNTSQVLRAAQVAFSQLERQATPTVMVNGVVVTSTLQDINQAIDQALALAGSRPDQPAVEVTDEPEATEEPAVDVTPEAESETTAEPDTEATDVPEASATVEPQAEATDVPELDATEAVED